LFAGGRRISYGARALTEGGYQAVPELTFPGGALIGCGAGFMDVPKIKGIHNAMKSGMAAAEAVADLLASDGDGNQAAGYRDRLEASWVMAELKAARNIRPGFRFGLLGGLLHAAVDTYILRGRAPWTLDHHRDHEETLPASTYRPMDYPKPDGKLTFDRLSSVFISNTNHQENQPCHLRLADEARAININYDRFAAPETRYCPAGVYEIIEPDGAPAPRLQINGQNCVHCKACDIKDPTQNITWVVPEGGGGPNYPNM
jgi:electron-transferring-flavoprotein dehydrogenase